MYKKMVGVAIGIILILIVLLTTINITCAAELSQNQIYSASIIVKNYVEKNGQLPNYVMISGKEYSMNEYEYLICKSIVTKYNGKTSNIKIKTNITNPSNPFGDSISKTITKKQFVTMSKNVVNFIDKNNQAPNFVYFGTKKIQHQTFIYGMSRVGTFIRNNKKMPASLLLNVKNTHSMNKNTQITPAMNRNAQTVFNNGSVSFMNTKTFLNASTNVKNWIEANGKLPAYVTISGKQYNMPNYLGMASNAIASYSIYTLGNELPISNISDPVRPYGNNISTTITSLQYYDMAQRTSDFCVKNARAPSTVGLGNIEINYQTTIYLFSKVLNYYNKNSGMPNYVQINTIY